MDIPCAGAGNTPCTVLLSVVATIVVMFGGLIWLGSQAPDSVETGGSSVSAPSEHSEIGSDVSPQEAVSSTVSSQDSIDELFGRIDQAGELINNTSNEIEKIFSESDGVEATRKMVGYMLLIVGPLLEEKYGSSNILFVILATALVTGIVHCIFFPHIQLLGASGVVFAFILLSPFTSVKEGTIPITLVLVAALYIGGQIYSGIVTSDNISQLTHIIGGCVGAGLGYVMHKNKMNRY